MLKVLRKALAVFTVLMLVAGLMAGCGNSGAKTTEATPTVQPGNSASVTQEATPAPQKLDEVTLRMYFPGDKRAALDDVWAAVEQKTKDKLNAKFEVNFIPWNDYQDKIQLMLSSGDDYDFNFDGTWLMYSKMVNKDAYLDLKELAPQYMPEYYKRLDDAGVIKGAMSNGKLLCIPWTPVFVNKPLIKWNEVDSGMDKVGVSYENGSIKTIEDLDKFLYDVKAKVPGKHYWETSDVQLTTTGWLLYPKYNYDYSFNFHTFTYKLDDPGVKLIPLEQTEMFKEIITYNTKWVKDGVMPDDLIINRDGHFNEAKELKIAGIETMEYVYYDNNYKKPGYKYSEIYPDGMWTQRSPIDNVSCINKSAANPERMLMFLEEMATNQEVYDLVIYGLEGQTYVKNGDSYDYPAGMTPDTSNYMEWSGQWGLWRDYEMRASGARSKESWDKNAEFANNPKFIISPTVSFSPDTESIKNELATRDALFEEYAKPLLYGLSKNPEKDLADYIQKQKDAGLDKIMAEMQKQIDAYLATK